MTLKRISAVVAAASASVFVLVGCSSSDSDSGPSAAEDPQAALQQAAETYAEGFYEGDASAAYDLFTKSCKETFSKDEYKALADFAQATPNKITSVEVTVDGDKGKMAVNFEDESDNDRNAPWVLEDGKWRFDDCRMRE
ncbi:hypothetical protein AAC389_06980 [Rhodococcus qingshengii]|uniref:hypothetical protein n=1 Tax=Rhodococcus qingshengii TaxID=334542 RepID=UPI00311CBA1C